MIIVDTGVLYSFFVADDPAHHLASEVLTSSRETLVLSPLVVAEIDYFILRRFGPAAERAMLLELSEGLYEIPAFQRREMDACHAVLARYADQSLGITDSSLAVYADAYKTSTIATFDRRHFTMLRASDGSPFTLLP